MANSFPSALGTDFYCLDDISDDFAYEEDPVQAYVQACYRRLIMLNLFYVEAYGAGIFRFILETGVTNSEIRGVIVDALLLDERTQNVEVTFVAGVIRIQVTPRFAAQFKFTLEIDRVAATLYPTEG